MNVAPKANEQIIIIIGVWMICVDRCLGLNARVFLCQWSWSAGKKVVFFHLWTWLSCCFGLNCLFLGNSAAVMEWFSKRKPFGQMRYRLSPVSCSSVSVHKTQLFFGHPLFRAPEKAAYFLFELLLSKLCTKTMTLKAVVNYGSIARSDFCFVFFSSSLFQLYFCIQQWQPSNGWMSEWKKSGRTIVDHRTESISN